MIKYCHEKNKNQKEAYSANTEFTPGQLELQGLETVKTRKIIVRNDGKANSSDAGLLLLQQVEQKHRIIESFQDVLPIAFFTTKDYGKDMGLRCQRASHLPLGACTKVHSMFKRIF